MNDRAITTRIGPNIIGGIKAFGGAGDDVLTGSPTDDLLDGGGGTDVLTGGDGLDLLTDGDRDGAAENLGPDGDMLDGGPGADTLSYAKRTRGLVVDLATDDPVGEPGEGDVASGFESVVGGKGNDWLAGDRRGNSIDGGGGANRLIGRGGDDFLSNASGRTVRCGRGFDGVAHTRAHTLVPPSCERLSVRLPRGAFVDGGAVVSPIPQRRAGALGLDLWCPDIDGIRYRCQATVRIVARLNHRLLAIGRFVSSGGGEDPHRFLRLHLTALGLRLEGDDRR
jgi:Ca2+-binding RTX toxin-like protein